MNAPTIDLDRLADSIATLILSRAERPPRFWTYADIAYNLRAGDSKVRAWAARPDFPAPIRVPTAGTGIGHPLYDPAEVVAWARRFRDGAGRPGRPRKAAA